MKTIMFFTSMMFFLMFQVSAWASAYKDVADGTVIEGIIDSSNVSYIFKVRVPKDSGIKEIEVFSPANKKIQSIEFPSDAEGPCSDCNLLEFIDLNFDGFKDLLLLVGWGSGGSMYDPWIYNPKRKQFEQSNLTEVLENPTVDKKKKEVITTSPMGCCAGTIKHFKVNGNKFTCVSEESYRSK